MREKIKFCLGERWLFNVFVILKATFSKRLLIKISMACVYIKSEVKKKWSNSNDYRYKWSLYRVITWRLLFDGEGMTLLVAEDANVLRATFLVEKISNSLAVFPPSPRFLINVQGNVGTLGWGNKATSKQGTFLVSRSIHGE